MNRGPGIERARLLFGAGTAVALGLGALLYPLHRRIDLSSFAKDDPALIGEGRKLFLKLRCFYCHRVGGDGGTAGPALDRTVRKPGEWLMEHFRDPAASSPLPSGGPTPTDEDVQALIAFSKSRQAETAFTDDAP
ncbi:MAG: cytochrome c [Elusimicrobia bacterium]|nr:cytochrome c [Elusimicrobiota bacterium]